MFFSTLPQAQILSSGKIQKIAFRATSPIFRQQAPQNGAFLGTISGPARDKG
ncbi:hypothetical protein LZA78_15225 [Sinirhodobacter sp. WL0062]|uniref:Uncharacterized protein n=1 Tax=Rhodobacter flavimaris TaxID=2907145 RepID=A0ABS8Z252_9RHOB|nr:hypothetical protein [Sinirhodobacter sp. WL0062]MCE5974839.1 hypothetical protein [Sinirhodobacter sp. WL0062]